jgi:hypothetical protein
VNTLVVVLTTARPGGADYLAETLDALDREGADDRAKYVVSDGPLPGGRWRYSHLDGAGWGVSASFVVRGSRNGHWRALYLAAALDADRLLFFEDDARPVRNAVRYLLDLQVPEGVGMVSCCDIREVAEGAEPGIYVRPAMGTRRKGFQTSVALVVPGRTVRDLVRRDPLAYLADRPDTADMALGAALEASAIPYYGVLVPGLFRHAGDVSCVPGSPIRQARNLPAEPFDALSLPREPRLHGAPCARCGG